MEILVKIYPVLSCLFKKVNLENIKQKNMMYLIYDKSVMINFLIVIYNLY